MPEMDGVNIINKIKRNKKFSKIKVIFVSADPRLEEIAIKNKAHAWVPKPFDLVKLERTVSELIN
jgi:CheY-like chemotaxis protein